MTGFRHTPFTKTSTPSGTKFSRCKYSSTGLRRSSSELETNYAGQVWGSLGLGAQLSVCVYVPRVHLIVFFPPENLLSVPFIE